MALFCDAVTFGTTTDDMCDRGTFSCPTMFCSSTSKYLHRHSDTLIAPQCQLCGMQAPTAPYVGAASSQWRSHSSTPSSLRHVRASSTPSVQCIVTVAVSQHTHHTPTFMHVGTSRTPSGHCIVTVAFSQQPHSKAPTAPHLGTASSQLHSHSTTLSSLRHTGASSTLSRHCIVTLGLS